MVGEPSSNLMNSFIAAAARGERPGLIDRLQGTPPLEHDRRERLTAAMAEHEGGQRQGDHIAAQLADEKIEAVLAEARQAADAATQGQEPPAGSGFDGGVHNRRSVAPPTSYVEESPAQLFLRAISASRAERAERADDEWRAARTAFWR
jgi:hypothetical protein